jgi:hypothetical protein
VPAKRAERWKAPKPHCDTHVAQQPRKLAQRWVCFVLETDERSRRQGLDNEYRKELDSRIAWQRADLRQLPARGHARRIFPVLWTFCNRCRDDASLPAGDENVVGDTFLQGPAFFCPDPNSRLACRCGQLSDRLRSHARKAGRISNLPRYGKIGGAER